MNIKNVCNKGKNWVKANEEELIFVGILGLCFTSGIHIGRRSTYTVNADDQVAGIIDFLDKHPSGAMMLKANNKNYFVVTETGLKEYGNFVKTISVKG